MPIDIRWQLFPLLVPSMTSTQLFLGETIDQADLFQTQLLPPGQVVQATSACIFLLLPPLIIELAENVLAKLNIHI